jgi:hypothetical protein
LRNVLPVFLPTEWREIEERPRRTDLLDTAPVEEIRLVDAVAVANEDDDPEHLLDAEVLRELVTDKGDEGKLLPPHPLLELCDALLRGGRDEYEARVASGQMCRMGHRVSEKRAAGAGSIRPVLDVRGVEEAVNDQLAPPGEQVEEVHLTVGADEAVAAAHGGHRQSPTLGGEPVARLHQRLLFDQQIVAGRLPFVARDDLRQRDRLLLHRW